MIDPEAMFVDEDGEAVDVIAFADEDMDEVESEADAFYMIVRHVDGDLEAYEIERITIQ